MNTEELQTEEELQAQIEKLQTEQRELVKRRDTELTQLENSIRPKREALQAKLIELENSILPQREEIAAGFGVRLNDLTSELLAPRQKLDKLRVEYMKAGPDFTEWFKLAKQQCGGDYTDTQIKRQLQLLSRGMVGHGAGGSELMHITITEKGKQNADSERPNAYVAPGFGSWKPEPTETQVIDTRKEENKA
jgi:hypothetical protein